MAFIPHVMDRKSYFKNALMELNSVHAFRIFSFIKLAFG